MHLGDDLARSPQPLVLRVVGRRVRERAGLVRPVELKHVRAGAVLEFLGPLVGDHLATGEHDAQRRQVVAVQRGRVEHHDELRRHRREHRDPVVLDGPQHGLDVEARAHDARRARDRRREVRGPEPEAERRGQRGEEHVVRREVRHSVRELVKGEPARLRVHDDLRQARRPRGRVEQPQGVGADRSFGTRARERRRLAEQRARAAALDEMRHLSLAGTRSDADRDDAGLLAREHRRVRTGTVGDLQRDAVARIEDAERRGHRPRRARRTRPTSCSRPTRLRRRRARPAGRARSRRRPRQLFWVDGVVT